jgi:glycerol kinase
MGEYIGALDQGTTSTRFLLFDRQGQQVAGRQLEHRQIYPRPGWVEHDPHEIWEKTCAVIVAALNEAGVPARELAAVGITNQRETTVVWDPRSGRPYGNAVVWQDTRTDGIVAGLAAEAAPKPDKDVGAKPDEVGGGLDRFRATTGLPLATYFSAPKLQWLLENTPGLRLAAERGQALFGTVDSWLAWQLTGGPGRGRHLTEPSNASRTLLFGLESQAWEPALLEVFGVPQRMMPEVLPSIPAEPYGHTAEDGPFGARIPVAGILGDQQAALFGQACFAEGESKNTYGTGCFLLFNTGRKRVASRHGLLSTVAWSREGQAPVFALEGSIAITGALVQWLRDNLGLIGSSAEIEPLAAQAEDCGGVYFVPAFSGLFAPHWRSDARGVIVGLSRFANKAHLARAALEATAFQTLEVFQAMTKDSGIAILVLKVDGGMTGNELLMQFQADLLGVPVVRPQVRETTALGAAFAAGVSVGFWQPGELESLWREDRRWLPAMGSEERERRCRLWRKAVERSLDWVE